MRALYNRLSSPQLQLNSPYRLHRPQFMQANGLEFEASKVHVQHQADRTAGETVSIGPSPAG